MAAGRAERAPAFIDPPGVAPHPPGPLSRRLRLGERSARRRHACRPRARRTQTRTDHLAPAQAIALTWMQRLKRVFGIEIERCRRCGGALEVIASIEDPGVIERILAHRQRRSEE